MFKAGTRAGRCIAEKILCCILAVFMTAPVLCCQTGCSVIDDFRNKMIDTSEAVPVQELARLIINAIKNKNGVSDCYSQIPQRQLGDISYSVFNEYVAILRSASVRYGTIQSFKLLSKKESEEYIQELLRLSRRTEVPDLYGDLVVVELDYGDSLREGTTSDHFRFMISVDDSGTACLSKSYVTGTIAAYNYLEHYFTMLEERNTSGLFALLAPLYTDDIYINAVINAKAAYIAEYYLIQVRSTRDEYIVDEVTPFYVHTVIPKVIDIDGESLSTHEVSLSVSEDGRYDIDDQIPWISEQSVVSIYDKDGSALRIQGVSLNESRLEILLGTPIYIKEYELTEEEAAKTGKTLRIRAVYPGLSVTLCADRDDSGKWEGDVIGISMFGNEYSIDQQVSVGMNISELLLIYPMLDEAGYTFNYQSGIDTFNLRFDFDEYNNIEAIRIVRNDLL
ncbi:hypothetical protein SAMN02910456_00030 [Ruminococcaceae bacterium YRB3002]|nr:hypothetical protein SAMN02910456_00030 [Ruminococcaceae bacterium YRB3002]